MSESVARGRGVAKQTCRKCGRTIYVMTIDGERVETDPELVKIVSLRPPAVVLGRRVHGELCLRYELEAERRKAKARWGNKKLI